MRTPRSKIRHLTYKKHKNITLYHFRPSSWKGPEVKETLMKKANTKRAVPAVPVLVLISLLIVSAVLLAIFLIRLN